MKSKWVKSPDFIVNHVRDMLQWSIVVGGLIATNYYILFKNAEYVSYILYPVIINDMFKIIPYKIIKKGIKIYE
ncbi:MAG: hypothetical protein FJZ16_10215 [Candidatus Omnitrophica bacterium]|nr:hypothetical protein [Candidatus Omnitrophota bacterium]